MTMNWVGDRDVMRGMDLYARKVRQVLRQIADYWGGVLEAYAKANAPWEDQTGNARQALHAFVEEVSRDESVIIYLSHGVDYGLWLEIRFAGRYAIIWPTIEEHIPQIRSMIRSVFS